MNGGVTYVNKSLLTHMKKSEKESLDFQKQDPLLKQHSMEITL